MIPCFSQGKKIKALFIARLNPFVPASSDLTADYLVLPITLLSDALFSTVEHWLWNFACVVSSAWEAFPFNTQGPCPSSLELSSSTSSMDTA